jgi:hypothetical protein
LLGLGRVMFNSCSKGGLPSRKTILISTHLGDFCSLLTTSPALRFIATKLCSLLFYQTPISVICESVEISISSPILIINVSTSRTIRIPLDSGLIFAFASSILVYRREQWPL